MCDKEVCVTVVLFGRYVDDVINRIDRMFPEMSIQLSRPNGTSAMLLVSWVLLSFLMDFLRDCIAISKRQAIKDCFFSQKHSALHLTQRCKISFAFRQIDDKKNFTFKCFWLLNKIVEI